MPKIYTRTGDEGETSLVGGSRVRKDELRVETMGAIDELNAAMGAVRAELARGGTAPVGLDSLLAKLQHELFDLGGQNRQVSAGRRGRLRSVEESSGGQQHDREPARAQPGFIANDCPSRVPIRLPVRWSWLGH